MKVTRYLSLSSLYFGLTSALVPIHTKGNRFIKPAIGTDGESNDGEVFFPVGLDYQIGGASGYSADSDSDALTDSNVCLRDAFVFNKLGINTIRIYSVNPSLNHDECMTIFNNAGIYVILDVNAGTSDASLNRYNPSSSYNAVYMTRVFEMIEAFSGFPNVLGFFSANEVMNDAKSSKVSPPYVRAVQRDMKNYMDNNSNRTVPVGYSAASDEDIRITGWKYLECGTDDSKSDFYGLNSYDWCSGSSDWDSSNYDLFNSTFTDSSIPLIFSEYGCNKNSPRTFDEVDALYNGLGSIFSGGLVYEYSNETNNYGIVTIDGDNSVHLTEEFDNLLNRYNKLDLKNISESNVQDIESSDINKCNSSEITSLYSSFNSSFTLPSPSKDIQWMIDNGQPFDNFGKIVDLNSTQTTYKIYGSDGDEITDTKLTFKPENLVNNLNEEVSSSTNAASSSATSSGKSSSSSKKNDGNVNGFNSMNGIFVGFVAVLMSFL